MTEVIRLSIKEEIFAYAKENFGSEPEFLWQKYPDCAVLRNDKNSKWYAILMNVPASKLGLKDSRNIDILDVKCDPIMISSLIDNKRYFKAYHMNKEHWITLVLNGEISKSEIFDMMCQSFELVNTKVKKNNYEAKN